MAAVPSPLTRSSMSQSFPPGGGKGAMGKGGEAAPQILIQNFVTCCPQTETWFKILTSISLIVSTALLAFLVCYHIGVFHFEHFIGPIGSISSITGASTLVALSLALLGLSFKK